MSVVTLPIVLAAVFTSSQADADKILKNVHKQARAAADATVHGEFGKLADLTYPKLVKMMGAKKKMVEACQALFEKMKEMDVKIVALRVKAPTRIFRARGELMTVVPITMEMTLPAARVKAKSYLVGVSKDRGKHWTFLDGNVGAEKIREFLPHMPKEMKLPAVEKTIVEKGS